MKIIKKRAFASLIDGFLFATPIALLQLKFPNLLAGKGWMLAIIFIPFLLRDVVFRNASIGKRLLGIAIYTKDWEKPSLKCLMLRSFCTATVSYVRLCSGGNKLSVLDWERDTLGAYVIDMKVYKELSEKANQMNGEFPKNMSDLYNAYLRNLYA